MPRRIFPNLQRLDPRSTVRAVWRVLQRTICAILLLEQMPVIALKSLCALQLISPSASKFHWLTRFN